eukprot:NODE_1278_length_570_cov_15.550864_g1203_i0.p2 GENE.NODE_1278_length_570_cov_15.550864_g1203_i0~~NODE_1278_length_570_cov_15.550864_g1203_i0.p2  ORF type:complete len:59 (+),score=13.88 NODE_1278_length_570_cov_15.550864_g1203_i0:353-529(+)
MSKAMWILKKKRKKDKQPKVNTHHHSPPAPIYQKKLGYAAVYKKTWEESIHLFAHVCM